MRTDPTPTDTPDDLAYGQSPEGIDRAEDLAADMIDQTIEATALAGLDTTITATFMVAELLAELQVRARVEPEALIAQFRYLIDERAEHLRADLAGEPCPACTVDAGRVLH